MQRGGGGVTESISCSYFWITECLQGETLLSDRDGWNQRKWSFRGTQEQTNSSTLSPAAVIIAQSVQWCSENKMCMFSTDYSAQDYSQSDINSCHTNKHTHTQQLIQMKQLDVFLTVNSNQNLTVICNQLCKSMLHKAKFESLYHFRGCLHVSKVHYPEIIVCDISYESHCLTTDG